MGMAPTENPEKKFVDINSTANAVESSPSSSFLPSVAGHEIKLSACFSFELLWTLRSGQAVADPKRWLTFDFLRAWSCCKKVA